ncbi:MAG: M15 family metallopeptidase [Actinobacteria bacterium]|nr:M15 family metallopeptidase [Actinomycetota bacterium]
MQTILRRLRQMTPTTIRTGVVVPLALALVVPLLISPTGAREPEPGTGSVEVAPDQAIGTIAAPETPSGEDEPPGSDPVFDARPAVADDVPTVRPDLLIRPGEAVDPSSLFAVLGVDGVEHLAGTAEQTVQVGAPQGQIELRVLVVDPTAFRPLTPEATARTREVWERLSDGEAIFRHDVAKQHGLELGAVVPMTGPTGRATEVRIGGYASNGSPPLADAIVPWEVGGRIGVAEPNLLVVALTEQASRTQVIERVREAVGVAEITEVEEPPTQQASLVGAGAHRFESFSYIDHGDGMIAIDPGWVRRNIVYADVPIFGTVRCHKAMIPQLRAALQEVVDRGLANMIDTSDYGGCWVPRHILFDPDRSLSMHAWGLAIDFNVHTNMYGDAPTLDQRIVDVFRRWGFEWGGDWSMPDGMHFELNAIIK